MKLQKIFNRYELEEGAIIPKGYGFSYLKLAEAKAVFYPIPLNLLVNFHRKIHELLVFPSRPKYNKLVHSAYMKGRAEGIRLMQKRIQEVYVDFRKERGWH